jgi:hypothetical protein
MPTPEQLEAAETQLAGKLASMCGALVSIPALDNQEREAIHGHLMAIAEIVGRKIRPSAGHPYPRSPQ